ncbi:MAG TPA: hypothetical protein VMM12_15380 [Longimicrobiales bacterium]|nr:hypothetical protein [Longimicrobiales bacterium]
MAQNGNRWPRIHEDGAEWEARVVAGPQQSDPMASGDDETLEFVCLDGTRGVRRIAVAAGSVGDMDELALRRAYLRARPIGGDHYGRPGKRMNDAP